jgi:hypothetical protein
VASDPGTYAVWRVDLSHREEESRVVAEKVNDVPEASFLNGTVCLPFPINALLMADSTLGLVFRLGLETLVLDVAIDISEIEKCSENVLEGINGSRVLGSML